MGRRTKHKPFDDKKSKFIASLVQFRFRHFIVSFFRHFSRRESFFHFPSNSHSPHKDKEVWKNRYCFLPKTSSSRNSELIVAVVVEAFQLENGSHTPTQSSAADIFAINAPASGAAYIRGQVSYKRWGERTIANLPPASRGNAFLFHLEKLCLERFSSIFMAHRLGIAVVVVVVVVIASEGRWNFVEGGMLFGKKGQFTWRSNFRLEERGCRTSLPKVFNFREGVVGR